MQITPPRGTILVSLREMDHSCVGQIYHGDWGCLRVMSMTVMEVIFIMPEILPYGWCLEFEESCCENNGSIINSTVKSFPVMNSFSGELRGVKIK